MKYDFTGKVVLITGGSRGIGKAIVENFSRAGAKTLFTYASSTKEADALCSALNAEGFFARSYQGDVKNADAMASLVNTIAKEFSQIDVLINNAGITRDGLTLMMDKSAWEEVLATNLFGAVHTIKPVAKLMLKKRNGVIINMSSVAASKPGKGHANYAASKGALESMTKALAAELGGRNIRVVGIAPGLIETDMSSAVVQAAGDQIKDSISLGRFGTPQDIANAALFLASDYASYITGEILHVTGGMKG